jgi:hypothetical protein
MAKKHDERKDLKCVSKVAEINGNRIVIPTDAVIGIHTWGRIDFLIHYCGYILYRAKNVKASNLNFKDTTVSAREAKKIKKEHKLTNKKK